MEILLGDLAKFANASELINFKEDVVVKDFSTDTRKLPEGSLFVAIKGENFDGNDFLKVAEEKGAIAILANNEAKSDNVKIPIIKVKDTIESMQFIAREWRKNFKFPIISLTGSNGKTTTKTFLSAIVSSEMPVLFTEGNLNNHIGVPMTLLKLSNFVNSAIIEMGTNHFGEIETLMKTALPTAGMITNIGLAHIESFGSREGVFKAKTEMFDFLETKTEKSKCIYPADDVLFTNYFTGKHNLEAVSFGFSEKADYKAYDLKVHVENDSGIVGTKFFVKNNQNQTQEVFLPFIGNHNVSNALASITAAQEVFNIDLAKSAKALRNVKPAKWRSDLKQLKNGAWLLADCYNANPSSFSALVDTLSILKKETNKKVILVTGDMRELGPKTPELHYELGQNAAKKCIDEIYSIGEFAKFVASGVNEVKSESKAFIEENKKEIYKKISEYLTAGYIIAVKGSRSAKLEEIVELIGG